MRSGPTPVGLSAPCLRFALTNGRVKHGLVLSLGEVAFIGRASRSTVVVDDISVSSQHVELSLVAVSGADGSSRLVLRARDCSQNGTGLVDAGLKRPITRDDVRSLSRREPEDLFDGSALVVPLRRKGTHGKVETNSQNIFFVRLCPSESPTLLHQPIEQPCGAPELLPLEAGSGNEGPLEAREAPEEAAEHLAETPCPPVARLKKPLLNGASTLPDCYDPETGFGRWHYTATLGEGGLGAVYRATDCKGSRGEVAIKVLKYHERANWGKQHAFAMHRESQWSIQHLHNEKDPRFDRESSLLFARYLEDHTGFRQKGPSDFEERRRLYEAPGFDWEREVPDLPSAPYVVMELCVGEALHMAIDRVNRRRTSSRTVSRADEGMSLAEKREVLVQAARALEYLSTFDLLHRDFRGCNMHVERRASGACVLKVLDLGVMICAEDGQQWNTNQSVQAFRRRGETEEKRRRYDWLPWEVRAGADGSGPAVNFSPPTHSFDVFSLGVLALHLLLGRTAARGALENLRTSGQMADTSPLGVDQRLVQRMLGDACGRPHPGEIVRELQGHAPAELGAERSRQLDERLRSVEDLPRSSRSRSREGRTSQEQPSGLCSLSDSLDRPRLDPEQPLKPQPQAPSQAAKLSMLAMKRCGSGSCSGSYSRSRSRDRKPESEPQPEPQPLLQLPRQPQQPQRLLQQLPQQPLQQLPQQLPQQLLPQQLPQQQLLQQPQQQLPQQLPQQVLPQQLQQQVSQQLTQQLTQQLSEQLTQQLSQQLLPQQLPQQLLPQQLPQQLPRQLQQQQRQQQQQLPQPQQPPQQLHQLQQKPRLPQPLQHPPPQSPAQQRQQQSQRVLLPQQEESPQQLQPPPPPPALPSPWRGPVAQQAQQDMSCALGSQREAGLPVHEQLQELLRAFQPPDELAQAPSPGPQQLGSSSGQIPEGAPPMLRLQDAGVLEQQAVGQQVAPAHELLPEQQAAGQQAAPVHEQLQELLHSFRPLDAAVARPVLPHGQGLGTSGGPLRECAQALEPQAQSGVAASLEVDGRLAEARRPSEPQQLPLEQCWAAACGEAFRSTSFADRGRFDDALRDLCRAMDLGEQKEPSELCAGMPLTQSAGQSEYWLLTYPLVAELR